MCETTPEQHVHCRLGLARFCPAAGAPLPRCHEHRVPGMDAGTAAAPRTPRWPLLGSGPPQLERGSAMEGTLWNSAARTPDATQARARASEPLSCSESVCRRR